MMFWHRRLQTVGLRIKRAVLALLIVPLSAQAGSDGGTPARQPIVDQSLDRVSAHGRVVTQRYCGDAEGDPVASLWLSIEIELRNHGSRPLIVAREFGDTLLYRVARSKADAQAGRFVASFEGHEIFTRSLADSMPAPKGGASPDPEQFVVLQMGQSYVGRHDLSVLVARSDPELPGGIIRTGSRYFLRAQIRLWPFRTTAAEHVAELQQRWAQTGDLAIGSVLSDAIEFYAAAFDKLGPCSGE